MIRRARRFLTFVPFLLAQKGASPEQMGLLFTLVFAGGACGEFVCGPLAERLGAVRMVVVTELLTGLSILALLPLPLTASLVLLPVLGVFLNGTSSVLYATVAELVSPEARTRGYGLFYMLYQGFWDDRPSAVWLARRRCRVGMDDDPLRVPDYGCRTDGNADAGAENGRGGSVVKSLPPWGRQTIDEAGRHSGVLGEHRWIGSKSA